MYDQKSQFLTRIGVILTCSIVLFLIFLTINQVEGYSNHYDFVKSQQKSLGWEIGQGLQNGDTMTYKICNDQIMYQEIYPYHCYEISLEFVKVLDSSDGKFWVVQGYFKNHQGIEPVILLIDVDSFKVKTDNYNTKLGMSLEKTLFSLSKYDSNLLSIGTHWGEIDSYFSNSIPLEIKHHDTINILNTTITTSVLSYDIIKSSDIHISNDFPFPLKSNTYSPYILFPEPKELYYYSIIDYFSIGE